MILRYRFLLELIDKECLDKSYHLYRKDEKHHEAGRGGERLDAVHSLRAAAEGRHDDRDDTDRDTPDYLDLRRRLGADGNVAHTHRADVRQCRVGAGDEGGEDDEDVDRQHDIADAEGQVLKEFPERHHRAAAVERADEVGSAGHLHVHRAGAPDGEPDDAE